MRRFTSVRTAPVVAVLIVGLASCGGEDAAETTTTTTSTTTTTTTSTTMATITTTGPTTTTTLPPARIFPTAVACSSELPSFPCSALVDADGTTRWNAADGGVGAVVEFFFDPPIRLTEVVFENVTDEERYARNARIRRLQVATDDDPVTRWVELLDVTTPQRVEVSSEATAMLRMVVSAAYPGQAFEGRAPFEELALADIGFVGYVVESPQPPPESAVGRQPADGLSMMTEIDAGRNGRIDDLAFDGDLFMALVRLTSGESSVWSSPDGISWERMSVVGWFDPDDGPTHLTTVGESTVVVAGEHFGSATAWRTQDRATWREVQLDAGAVSDLATTPIGIVAVGRTAEDRAAAWWSDDGETWETTIAGDAEEASVPLDRAASSNEVLLALGVGRAEVHGVAVMTSLDGRVWRERDVSGLRPANVSDLRIIEGTIVALEAGGPVLWTATDPTDWQAEPLRWMVAPADRLATAVAVDVIGERLVVVGWTRPVFPTADDVPAVAEAWMREPDGIWIPLASPAPGETAMLPTGAVVGRGRLVVSISSGDTGLAVWVVQPA